MNTANVPHLPGFRGVVFDLDGVVADSEPLHIRAWLEVLEELGVGRAAVDEEEIRRWTGVPDVQIVAGVISQHGLPLSAEELLNRKRAAFRRLIPRALSSFAGVKAELHGWDGVSLGLATATARREADLMLEALGVREVFRVVVTGDDVARSKPAPDCYLEAARLLALPPQTCAAVEDAPHGIRAARGAGMFVLAVMTSFGQESLTEADLVFPSVLAAIRWLKDRTGKS